MSEKRSTFPLPLSSVTGPARKGVAPAPVATPQTATRNAAHQAFVPPAQPASPRQPGYAPPGKVQQHKLVSPHERRQLENQHERAGQERRQQERAAQDRPDMMVSDAVRRAMVARVERQGVRDRAVLAAMQAVPRHMFLEPAMSAQAYVDASLPIGHNQTISQPYIVARMIEAMQAGRPLGRVLEIGTGCGYQAAVLACVAQEVYSIERLKPLHELAKTNLRPLRIPNLRLHYGDGMLGLPQVAPFDGIILAAAGIEVPRALLEQLAIGARLVAPVGGQQQHLQRITRIGEKEWTSETLEACHFVPLRPGIA
ncbi:protein-L-isoaspartate(D-aspartate) O-methyltransferase [Massilia sp. S19_KUP03_FR1]|uniref:protein-L-isoaspartate(D-aspartate) O-methyltransferase n=1 Tax=Massilia sp. S19_KUP03_FR1 TaxID=3025503 RepID=UPI002FCD3382